MSIYLRLIFLLLIVYFSIDKINAEEDPQSKYDYAEIRTGFGFIDKTGKFVIPPKFVEVGPFSEGLATAGEFRDHYYNKTTGKIESGASSHGYIDHTGKFVIAPRDWTIYDFHQGVAVVLEQKRGCDYRLLNQSGNFVSNFSFQEACPSLSNKFITFGRSTTKWGCIDHNGKVVIEAKYDNPLVFWNGMSAIAIGGHWVSGCSYRDGAWCGGPSYATNSKVGLISDSGKILIEPKYNDIRPLSKDALFFQKNDKWGTLKPSGEIILQPQFDDVDQASDENARMFYENAHYLMPPSENMAIAKVGNKFVYLNSKGVIAIKQQFDDALPFHEGVAPVAIKQPGKPKSWGYINTASAMVIPAQFEEARCFSEGFAAVNYNHKWGLIDKKSHFLLETKIQFDK